MKRLTLNIFLGALSLFISSCSDILDEQPRSILTPELFKTTKGLESGLSASYSGLRYISGTEPTMCSTVLGTDEFTSAASGGSKELDMTPGNGGSPINSATGSINVFWNYPFTYINTCNGIIQFGTEAGLSKGLIAEAYFLRAYFYFMQVQMFGGVPLDLGSGELQFNTVPTTLSKRNTKEEVYTAIINDMKFAVENLPVNPRLTGCISKAGAIHYLSKIYLTTGNNQQALETAKILLDNQDTYGVGLLDSYGDVIRPGNERNKEILFTCEHTETYEFNETAAGFGSGPINKDDRSLSYFVPNYQTFPLRDGEGGFLVRSLEYSRPWIRIAPTYELITRTFADKTNDSRYYANFQSVWLNNSSTTRNGLLNQPLLPGDTAFFMPGYEVSDEFRASKNYRIWTPSQMKRDVFPSLKKFFDPKRQDINDASGRPFLLAKLSETYLIAAEAAINLGMNDAARAYIITLRRRAATSGNANKMEELTPSTITIDYLLDERSRELCGEQMRWFDLVRTGKWVERASRYSLDGRTYFERDIKSYYVLRPVPQSQINLMSNTDAEKSAYQNPGY